MRGVKASSPVRVRKTCSVCGSISVRRTKKYYKCAFCGAKFHNPGKVIINSKEV
jgi:ribosomal protein L37AE/L43A